MGNFGIVSNKLNAGPATFMPYATDTLLLTAMLSQKDHRTTLLDAVFPGGNGSLPFTDFTDALAGSNAGIHCGETLVDMIAVLNSTCTAHPCGAVEGSEARRRL